MIDPKKNADGSSGSSRGSERAQRDGENAAGRETERPIRRASGVADMPRDLPPMPEDPPPGNKVHGDKLGDLGRGEQK